MTRNLILSGGVAHEYHLTSPMLADILGEVGIESEIHEGFSAIEKGVLQEFDLLTLNCVRWTCSNVPIDHEWRKSRFELSKDARRGFLDFFSQGKGLMALHAATICFDDWDEYKKILGGWWEEGYSNHGPYQDYRMQVRSDTHPVTKGIKDFVIKDELYTNPRITDSVDTLVEGEWEGKMHPIVWARKYGKSRICYNALGHGVDAFTNPSYQKLLQRGALWVTNRLDSRNEVSS